MFDICPDCGVSFQDMISQDKPQEQYEMSATSDTLETPDQAAAQGADGFNVSEAGEQVRAKEIPQEPEPTHDFFVDPSEMREHDRFCWPGEIDFDKSKNDEFASADNNEFGEPGSKDFSSRVASGFEDSTHDPSFSALGAESESRKSGSTEKTGGFDGSLDEFESGPRFESFLEEPHVYAGEKAGTLCESCDEVMEPTLRDVYDIKRSHVALILAGVCLVLGLLGSAAVSLFEGYSLARLFVVYTTGMCLLFGAILSSIGAFMHLARERVYFCSSCRRVYPRR